MIAIEPEQLPKTSEENMLSLSEMSSSGGTIPSRPSAVSQKSVEIVMHQDLPNNPLNRSKLLPQRSISEVQPTKRNVNLRKTKNSSIESTVSLPNQKSLDKKHTLRHQKTINTQSDISLTAQPSIGDDRKALRDALYQGIFHRHRRTIFAVGSFLRMLRTKNSNYDSIRSDSDEV